MIGLASIIRRYRSNLEASHGHRLLPSHRRAIDAMLRCRTPDAGQIRLQCPGCRSEGIRHQSCCHRSCPHCQNFAASQWLDRQQAKLLPVEYFMVTFTLPSELRRLAWRHQKIVYGLLCATASSTLRDFGLDARGLGGAIGLTLVLHTHARNLDFHPHCHVAVPGGSLDRARQQWRHKRGRYLFNAKALARVFRARLLDGLNRAGLPIPEGIPHAWVVDCRCVGKGAPALKYLSRYLYRGVISERSIVDDRDGRVTFTFADSATGRTRKRTLPGGDFLWLLLPHVLPKGFRRVRDYGFLHGNAKRTLSRVQLALKVLIEARAPRPRPQFKCHRCAASMTIAGFFAPAWRSG
ncbi:MAG: transposase [Gammaproteobacteria bacterium]|nr:transposase [Gammaproteobacteria bacterium]